MEEIINKALEGGWSPHGSVMINGKKWHYGNVIANYYHQPTYLFDPLFWQALVSRKKIFTEIINKENKNYSRKERNDLIRQSSINTALKFYEINLTEGGDKAISYLNKLIK